MKMKWYGVLCFLILGVGFSGCGQNDESAKNQSKESTASSAISEKSSSSESSSVVSESTETAQTTNSQSQSSEDSQSSDLKNNFDAIKIGDPQKNGEGGTAIDDVKSNFGEPTNATDSENNGQKIQVLLWLNVKGGTGQDAHLTVTFFDGKAIQKEVTGIPAAEHEKVTLQKYHEVVDDSDVTAEKVLAAFGEPTAITESYGEGKKVLVYVWIKNVNGASISLTFVDGKLTSKTQSMLH